MKHYPLFALVLLLASCDKVENPLGEGSDNTPPPVDATQRKVLLEEYTGHKCPTCPAAHIVAAQLAATYGDRLIIVSEHVGSLALPEVVDYTTDFRTPAGNTYFGHWPTDIIPRGLVDRTPLNNNVVLSKDNWANAINLLIDQPATMKVEFSAFAYDGGTNTVSATVKCTPLTAVDHDLNLTVQLTEDHVIDWQYDGSLGTPNVPNYDHRHVLRDNLNGTWGEPLVTGSAPANEAITRTFNYHLPEPPAVNAVITPANCALVAYVWNAQGTANEYRVLQTEEHKFQP